MTSKFVCSFKLAIRSRTGYDPFIIFNLSGNILAHVQLFMGSMDGVKFNDNVIMTYLIKILLGKIVKLDKSCVLETGCVIHGQLFSHLTHPSLLLTSGVSHYSPPLGQIYYDGGL